MKGHIRERSPGHWAILIDYGRDARGKRNRRWHSFAGTKRQAEIERARLITEKQKGTAVAPERLTVADYLEQWLRHIRPRVSPKTFERYVSVVRANLIPALGTIRLSKLQPIAISTAYSDALGRLAPRTVNHMHVVFNGALKQAVRWRMIARNPCDDCDPPKVERGEMKVWTVDQITEAIELSRSWCVHMPMVLAAFCGLRRGEIAALRWHHVDLNRAQLSVIDSAEQTKAGVRYKAPKSGKGRTVALPAVMVSELRAHRLQQAQELLQLGVRLTDDTFVCARKDGKPQQPQSITHAWADFLASIKLPRIRFHDLRHSHATLMLRANVHPKIVSERLGHSKVAITLDTYSHVIPGMQEEAAAAIDAAFDTAHKPRSG
jgi:integrase